MANITIKRGTKAEVDGTSIKDGQLLLETDQNVNHIYLDDGNTRKSIANYVYTLPNATSIDLGGVKVGTNITNNDGTISLTKTNVTNALGYVPPTGVQNNLTSESTTDALSAKQGKALNDRINSITSSFSATGSTTQPIYFDSNGVAKPISYTIAKSVPSNAKFTDTVYTLPSATSSTLGGVKVGNNITNSSGTISLTKTNVVSALGYTPPTHDTNTWRPCDNTLQSTSTSNSLSAAQGNVLYNYLPTNNYNNYFTYSNNTSLENNETIYLSGSGFISFTISLWTDNTVDYGATNAEIWFNGNKWCQCYHRHDQSKHDSQASSTTMTYWLNNANNVPVKFVYGSTKNGTKYLRIHGVYSNGITMIA